MSRSSLRVLLAFATTLGLAAIASPGYPAASDPQLADPSPSPSVGPALNEGAVRVRRDGPSINLDSLLDTTQPDFYLNVEIPVASVSVAPEASPSVQPSPTPSPVAQPSLMPPPVPTLEPSATPRPQKASADVLYQAQRLAGLGQYRKALGLVEEAISERPDVASMHALRGSLLVKLHDDAEAERAWTRALELDPHAYDVKASLDWLRKRQAQ